MAEDSHFCPSPTEDSEDSYLAEDSGSGFDLVEHAGTDTALAENNFKSPPSDDSGSGSALTEVPDTGSNAAEKSDSGSAPPENLNSGSSADEKDWHPQCSHCQSNEFLIHQCWICGSFQGECPITISPLWETFKKTPTIKELRASAYNASKAGKCEICYILLSCLERCISPDFLLDDFQFYIQTNEQRRDQCLNEPESCRNRSLFVVIGKDCFDIDASMEIFIPPGSSSPWTGVQEAHFPPRNTASETSLAWATRSFQHCFKFHACCHIQNTDRSFPKRLVDVVDSRMDGSVRLIETSGRERPYLSLSHCWGDPTLHPLPLETTRDNLCRHLEGIPWDDLPKTFQDAVNFVRRLGERYIWIDSLCIMQDSTEDWTEESGKMTSIYQNSIITIAATKSDNSSGGCFSTPDVEYKAHPFAVKYSNGSYFTVYCRRSQPHWFHGRPFREAVQAPLLERAWVYQERQLSPRTVHFGDQELVWECREELFCECDLWKGTPTYSLKFQKGLWPAVDDRNNLEGPHTSTMPSMAESDGPNFVEIWHDVVKGYCTQRLTKASDRLPAIAGVARLIQNLRPNDEYLAGLWNNSLIEDLMWINYSPAKNRNTNLAPSWSWACIDEGNIEFETILDNDLKMASLLNTEMRPDGPDAYLNVPSGVLTIEGYLFATRPEDSLFCIWDATRWGLELYPSDSCSSSPPSQGFRIYDETPRTNSEFQTGSLFPEFSKVYYYPDCKISQFEPLYTASTILHCLWLIKRQSPVEGEYENNFLVLRQRQRQGVYERVGLLRTVSPFQTELPPVQEQTDGILKHTITIV
ncbi:heterokaryon incompatibility protein-domain-containing protein [Phyllosticta capitalensis]|uniref:Heterokaryon incompatibility protein-domain-containing protein n=1 Tax=Phyllosticta capitalensis TaxID=121624 RepID=A0ABR1YRQ2_9PEZI